MSSHGCSGNPPRSDQEAIDRILDAADTIVAERGSSLRIADVARTLGVTRQTVYRYFPTAEALLLVTSAMRSADGFIDRVEDHVRGLVTRLRRWWKAWRSPRRASQAIGSSTTCSQSEVPAVR